MIPDQDAFQVINSLCFNSNKLNDRERDALKVVLQLALDLEQTQDELFTARRVLIENGLASEIEGGHN